MRRVAITGIGIVSSIGNNVSEVTDSLRNGTSGIVGAPEYTELGFRSQVHGTVKMDVAEHVDRKQLRFMGEGAAYAVLAMEQAIADAGLDDSDVSNVRSGLVAGSGGPSTENLLAAFDITREKGPKRIGPYMVPRCMSSTVSACIATFFKIKGLNFSITSACSTSAHCISSGVDAIRNGSQDIVFAGGGEELHWTLSVLFDAMGAMSSKYNDTPERASRAYDADRDGFVIAGGGGMVVLEDMEHALARGATIHAEIVGYGANSDGHDMVAPSGEGAVRCMELALAGFDGKAITDKVDYINAHGTSTPVGDVKELDAVREVFGPRGYLPTVTSTKSLTGHSLGATGVQEAIYTMIMMKEGFIAASANIENPDPAIGDIPVPSERVDGAAINLALSNSFGFGGTNAHVVLGGALSFLIVFRTNSSYDRWWEARKTWQEVINTCRTFAVAASGLRDPAAAPGLTVTGLYTPTPFARADVPPAASTLVCRRHRLHRAAVRSGVAPMRLPRHGRQRAGRDDALRDGREQGGAVGARRARVDDLRQSFQ